MMKIIRENLVLQTVGQKFKISTKLDQSNPKLC